jgi:hypothetical protein
VQSGGAHFLTHLRGSGPAALGWLELPAPQRWRLRPC